MRVISGMAIKGAGLGSDKAVMGHAWWHWNPTVAWMDQPMAGGRMRGLQMRWLCFFCDICHFTKAA
jgi:hypothetical protein